MSTNYQKAKHGNIDKSMRLYIFILLASIIFFSACAKKDVEPMGIIHIENNVTVIPEIIPPKTTEPIVPKYAVVANKNMPKLSLKQIKEIFLKKITLINKLKIVPVNLGPKDELRLKFEKQVLKMDFEMLKTYWAQQYKTGQRPPVTMKSKDSTEAFLKKVDGSIGYMRIKDMDKSLKIIYKWSD